MILPATGERCSADGFAGREMIPAEVMAVLENDAVVEEHTIRLTCGQLPRSTYDVLKDLIERLGGKWRGGKVSALVFPYDPAPLLAGVLSSGMMPPKNPHAFFPTPQPVVDLALGMVDARCWYGPMRILEPSAGTGAFADALRRMQQSMGDEAQWTVDCCEIQPLNRATLQARGHHVVADDFLAYDPGAVYDAVVMNPPFSVPGDKTAYITHIRHAWTLLKPFGHLVAITPNGWRYRNDRLHLEFLDFVADYGTFEEVEAGAFSESGTGIATTVISLRKDDADIARRQQPWNGWLNWSCHQAALWADNDREHQDAVQATMALPRPERAVKLRILLDGIAIKAKRAYAEPIRLGDTEHAHLLAHYEEMYGCVDTQPVSVPAVKPQPGLFDMDQAA